MSSGGRMIVGERDGDWWWQWGWETMVGERCMVRDDGETERNKWMNEGYYLF